MRNTIALHNGYLVPTLGLGTWNADKKFVADAIKHAILETGYRHIDCASIYGNEKEIGGALEAIVSAQKIKREDLFVTSKLWNTDHEPEQVERACKQTLADLALDYLDLYLVHWGIAFVSGKEAEPIRNGQVEMAAISIQQTWKAMESLVKKGLVKSIGVANFTTMMLVDLLTYARIKPVINQVELHPYNAQVNLVEFCRHYDISMTAYSPLGSPGLKQKGPVLLEDIDLKSIAKKHRRTVAQIVLRWALQRGTIPIPKSTNTGRLDENFDVFDFSLSESEMRLINGLDRGYRYVNPVKWWGIPYFD